MPKSFFMAGAFVHWGLTLHAALCGKGWLNSSHDRKQITCQECLEALAEITDEVVAPLHDWDGLMSILDEHYPADVFDGSSGDTGPRIIVLLREVDRLRAEVARMNREEFD
jgi:hypothetical protein